jgi:hypothetical protein
MVSRDELSNAHWRKSVRSDGAGSCVSLACIGSHALIRDSKNPDSEIIILSKSELHDLINAAKAGEFDF